MNGRVRLLYWQELQRRWNARGLRRVGLLLLAIVVVQSLLALGLQALSHNGLLPSTSLVWLMAQFFMILNAPTYAWAAYQDPASLGYAGLYRDSLEADRALGLALSLPNTSWALILPAVAAATFATQRKRLGELLLAGYTPRQILAALGAAAVTPFLVLDAAGWLAGLTTITAKQLSGVVSPAVWGRVGEHLLPSALLLATGVVLLLAAALCRRLGVALAICYATVLVVLPGLYVARVPYELVPEDLFILRGIAWLLWRYPQEVFLVVAVCLLYRPALRSLAHPEEPAPLLPGESSSQDGSGKAVDDGPAPGTAGAG